MVEIHLTFHVEKVAEIYLIYFRFVDEIKFKAKWPLTDTVILRVALRFRLAQAHGPRKRRIYENL